MPVDMKRYPSDWHNITKRIRERDGDRCKFCGVQNHIYIVRRPYSDEYLIEDRESGEFTLPSGEPIRMSELPGWFHYDLRTTYIVLTTAHLGVPYPDGTPGNKHDKMDCRDENLASLCQKCHLGYDMDEHIANRKITTRLKRLEARRQSDDASGQRRMF